MVHVLFHYVSHLSLVVNIVTEFFDQSSKKIHTLSFIHSYNYVCVKGYVWTSIPYFSTIIQIYRIARLILIQFKHIQTHPSGTYCVLLFSFHSKCSKSNHILDFLDSTVFRVSFYTLHVYTNSSRIHLNTNHSTFNTYVFDLFWQYGVQKFLTRKKNHFLMVCLLIFFCIFDELFSYIIKSVEHCRWQFTM